MASRRYAFAKEAIDMGLAFGDPEYYRHACTFEEFNHLLNHVDSQAKMWLLKTERERDAK
jgi:hypothetical protein